MCKAFPTTLKGPARVWFNKITPNSISNFMELSGHFVMHFIGGQRYKRSLASLLNIKQREDESLRSYVARFNREVLFIDEADDKMLVTTSPMGYAPENSFSLFTRMTWRWWQTCYTKPPSTSILKMPWPPEGARQRKRKDRTTCIRANKSL